MLAYKLLNMFWTGEQIKSFRKQHKLSKRILAEHLGVSKNYIYMVEAGVRNPSKTLCLLLDRVVKEIEERKEVKKDG
jgi:DNA-binding XRE family transcriptional regulator